MEVSQLDFVYLLIWSTFSGVLLGLLYDGIKMLHGAVFLTEGFLGSKLSKIQLPIIKRTVATPESKINKAVSSVIFNLGDFIFMVAWGITIALIAYVYSSGKIRWYIPFGTILGFFAYRATLYKIVVKISNLVVFIIRGVAAYICFLAAFPIKLIVKIAGRIKNKRKEKGKRKWQILKKIKKPLKKA